MAKVNKYLLQGRKAKTQLHIDLQQIALEYEKFLNKKFCYLFQGNIRTAFQFQMDNFYHLLGFHKLTDVTVVRMVEDNRMKKEAFYKYIRSGKITMDFTDPQIVEDTYLPIKNICDTSKVSALGEVKASRLAFFTEKNVWDLLLSNPVIDFDSSDSDTVIEADKIFFKMISEKNRNLNLFIGFNEEERNHYTSTFFLEQVRDRYKKRKAGDDQPILNILSCRVVNTMNNKVEQFIVKWENVRTELASSPCYRAQNRLKKWIKSHHIESLEVEKEIHIQEQMLKELDEELLQLDNEQRIVNLCERLKDKDKKEDAILGLMDFDIDAEDETALEQYAGIQLSDIKNEIIRLQQKRESLDNKQKKHIQLLPDLKQLEREEIRLIYQPYVAEEIRIEILDALMEQENLFERELMPEEFIGKYREHTAPAIGKKE